MDSAILEVAGTRVLICAMVGKLLESERDANDFLAEAWANEVNMLAIPLARIGQKFFDLRTGIAGQIGQKFATYRMPLVIIGDLSEWTSQSRAFRDFVREASEGVALWFVADEADLVRRINESAFNP